MRPRISLSFTALLALLCAAPVPNGAQGTVINWGTPAPTVSVVEGIGTGGGTAAVSGANFVGSAANPPTSSLFLSGYPGPAMAMGVTYNTNASLALTLEAGVYEAGIYPFQIHDTDDQALLVRGEFTIGSELTPPVIFGVNLVLQGICAQATCTGGPCTTGSSIATVPDLSGSANPLNVVSATAPTIQQNDSRFSAPGVTTCVMSAANSTFLEQASLSIGGSPTALYVFGAFDVTATGATQVVWSHNASNLVLQANATPVWNFLPPGVLVASPPSPYLNPAIVEAGNNSVTSTAAVNNAIFASSAAANTIQNAKSFYVGFKTAASTYGSFVWPEIDVVNVLPTSTQAAQMAAYFNDTYGVTPLPGYSYNTGMAANTANAPLRIQNTPGLTNYYATTTVALVSGSTSYACTNAGLVGSSGVNSMDQLCASTPAGVYNLAITNPDRSAPVTYTNAVTVTSATTAWTNFGFSTLAWFSAANVTCSSSPCVSGSSGITSYFDQSAMGHTPTQSTFADEPIWHSGVGDATFNFNPYGLPNGTSDQVNFGTNPIVNDGSNTDFVAFGIVNEPVTGVTTGTFFEPINTGNQLRCQLAAKIPQTQSVATNATYGSVVAGTQNIECDLPGGASPTLYVNAANSGSPVTTATAFSANTFSGGQHLFVHSANGQQYSNAPMTEEVFLNKVPTSGQRIAWETYAQTKGAL